MPGGARTIGTVHAAEPMEIEWIEARAWRAEQGCERYARMDQRNRRAVLRCLRKQIIGGQQPAGARHALDDEIRLAGNVIAHMSCQQPRIFRIAAGNARADDEANLLALEEGLLRHADAGHERRQDQTEDRAENEPCTEEHLRSPLMPPMAPHVSG